MTKIHEELEGRLNEILEGRNAENERTEEVVAPTHYSLWIDDDAGKPGMEAWRSPPVGEDGWKVAHTTDEAIAIVKEFGIPGFIEFDHDLGILPRIKTPRGDDGQYYWVKDSRGQYDTVMLFLHWLFENHPTAIDHIQAYHIHSQSPVGAANIESFMSSWKRSRSLP